MSPPRPHLLELSPQELRDQVRAWGGRMTLPQARRLLVRLVTQGQSDLLLDREPLARATVALLHGRARWERPRVRDRVVDPVDGSVRYLFEAADGVTFEAVRIPLLAPGRFTVCLSSQAGCAMRCAFCATGRMGLTRHLDAHEMVAAFCTVRDEALADDASGRVTGAVFMGQGEPFHNYDAVIRAAQVIGHPCGGRVAAESITISTVGLVPQIRRYTAEGHNFRLIVSLTSAVAERRAALLPVAAKWSLPELAAAIADHHRATGKRVTIAWVLMGGVNTGADEVEALAELLGDVPVRLNLIDVNDAREGPGAFVRADDAERDAFLDALQPLAIPMVRRYSVGASQNSACGMLAGVAPPSG